MKKQQNKVVSSKANGKKPRGRPPKTGRRPQPGHATAPTQEVIPGGLTLTPEAIDRLIAEAQYQQHPYGKAWQRFDPGILAELVGNVDRRGLDQEILLYQSMVLDGWHRYLACLRTKVQPRFVEFKGTDLEAAEKVHASGVRRHLTAEQRYASFLLLCEACPAFKEKYERMTEQGTQQQQAGTPLSKPGQRVDVLGAKAKAAGVGRSTAAMVESLKKRKPEAIARIAKGDSTTSKERKKMARKGKEKNQTPEQQKSDNLRHLEGCQSHLDRVTLLACDHPELRHLRSTLKTIQGAITKMLADIEKLLKTRSDPEKIPNGKN